MPQSPATLTFDPLHSTPHSWGSLLSHHPPPQDPEDGEPLDLTTAVGRQACQAALPASPKMSDFLFAHRGSHPAQVGRWHVRTESTGERSPPPRRGALGISAQGLPSKRQQRPGTGTWLTTAFTGQTMC